MAYYPVELHKVLIIAALGVAHSASPSFPLVKLPEAVATHGARCLDGSPASFCEALDDPQRGLRCCVARPQRTAPPRCVVCLATSTRCSPRNFHRYPARANLGTASLTCHLLISCTFRNMTIDYI